MVPKNRKLGNLSSLSVQCGQEKNLFPAMNQATIPQSSSLRPPQDADYTQKEVGDVLKKVQSQSILQCSRLRPEIF
jgi:hypothetical protein